VRNDTPPTHPICGYPTSEETRRYDPSGHCKRRVKREGELCGYHELKQARVLAADGADRHE
jgi:hypothetical protein